MPPNEEQILGTPGNVALILFETIYLITVATYMLTTHLNKSNFYVAARQPQLLQVELLLNGFISVLFGECFPRKIHITFSRCSAGLPFSCPRKLREVFLVCLSAALYIHISAAISHIKAKGTIHVPCIIYHLATHLFLSTNMAIYYLQVIMPQFM